MGTKIVSTEGAGLDGRGGTCTGLVRLRRDHCFELLRRKIRVDAGHC